MKLHSKNLLLLLLCLISATSFSQSAQKKVYAAYPDVVECNTEEFRNAFTKTEGENISLNFSDDLTISGTVIHNSWKYDNLQSLTIKVPAFADAIFHLSKQVDQQKNITYVGRIFSPDASDGYEIKQDLGGNYQLKKITVERLRPTCNN